MAANIATKLRQVLKVIKPMRTSDGDGVALFRSIGGPKADHFDPYLLLDEFKSENPDDYIGGFPDHPHRGFSTVTYMLQGHMEHRDHKGNKGNLVPGSIQFMTAGRGIVHSEMPKQENGLMHGFQLWINLPAKYKMIDPNYQDISPDNIPEITSDAGVKVRIMAGEYGGQHGPVKDIGGMQPIYLDVTVPAGAAFTYDVPEELNVFSYIFEGKARINNEVQHASMLILYKQEGTELKFETTADSHARFLIVAGRPIKEPIARYGPFVMNTREEIMQAFMDFQNGVLQK